MARSVVIVVSEDANTISKVQGLAQGDVTVKVFSSTQWNSHLEDKTFRQQLHVSGGVDVQTGGATVLPFPGTQGSNPGEGKAVSTINDLESMAIQNAIFEYKGNLTEAAKALGIGRATLYRKVKQYNIDPSLARKRMPKAA